MTKNYCIDCGEEIYKTSTRCNSCENYRRHNEGIYKDINGKNNPSKRSAVKKKLRKASGGKNNAMYGIHKFGKNAPAYINGRAIRKYYCIDCGKKITRDHIRCSSCAKKGKKNVNWNNGSSFEPYTLEFNKQLKEQIKKRDNYQCQLCGEKKDLVIHHINYDKKNSSPDNLITLCRGCNNRVNSKRIFWTGYFIGYVIGNVQQKKLEKK